MELLGEGGTLLELSIAFSIFTLVIYLMQLVREGKVLPNADKKRLAPALAATAVASPFIVVPLWKKDIMVTLLIVAITATIAYVAYRWRK